VLLAPSSSLLVVGGLDGATGAAAEPVVMLVDLVPPLAVAAAADSPATTPVADGSFGALRRGSVDGGGSVDGFRPRTFSSASRASIRGAAPPPPAIVAENDDRRSAGPATDGDGDGGGATSVADSMDGLLASPGPTLTLKCHVSGTDLVRIVRLPLHASYGQVAAAVGRLLGAHPTRLRLQYLVRSWAAGGGPFGGVFGALTLHRLPWSDVVGRAGPGRGPHSAALRGRLGRSRRGAAAGGNGRQHGGR